MPTQVGLSASQPILFKKYQTWTKILGTAVEITFSVELNNGDTNLLKSLTEFEIKCVFYVFCVLIWKILFRTILAGLARARAESKTPTIFAHSV